jgi:hypothetical protein
MTNLMIVLRVVEDFHNAHRPHRALKAGGTATATA